MVTRLVGPLAIALIAACGTPPTEDSAAASSQVDIVSGLVPVPGGQLEYELRGDGEPVLFIHGSGVAATFLPVVHDPSLEGFRLIRLHRRGYAGSTSAGDAFSIAQDAADAAALLQHLGVDRAHVVGHSAGGIVALQLALDYADLVHSLALLEPPLSAWMAEREPRDRDWQGNPAKAVDDFFRQRFIGGPDWQAEVERTVPGGPEQAMRDASRLFVVEFPALARWAFDAEEAGRVSVPILYMRGENGFPRGQNIDTWWPEREITEVPEAGHMFPAQDPRATASGIADFIARHPL